MTRIVVVVVVVFSNSETTLSNGRFRLGGRDRIAIYPVTEARERYQRNTWLAAESGRVALTPERVQWLFSSEIKIGTTEGRRERKAGGKSRLRYILIARNLRMRFVRSLTYVRTSVFTHARTYVRLYPSSSPPVLFFIFRFSLLFFGYARAHTNARARARACFPPRRSLLLPPPSFPCHLPFPRPRARFNIFKRAKTPGGHTAAPLRQRDIKTTGRNAGCAKC